jgi:hypothetical protein
VLLAVGGVWLLYLRPRQLAREGGPPVAEVPDRVDNS